MATLTRRRAQFFINVVDNARLDYRPDNDGYAVFGKVVEGMDVVDKIRAAPTGSRGPAPRCSGSADYDQDRSHRQVDASTPGARMVRLYTNYGPITIELDHERAPKTAANFENYVRNGFYDGTLFHRVINGFMIQGGGFEPGMRQKTAEDSIENEARNGLRNAKYTVAMARTGDPHSASSQFFINVADNEFLNHTSPSPQGWGYCVFGKVIEGTDTVDKIKVLRTGRHGSHQDVPEVNVLVERAEIIVNLRLIAPPALAVTQSIEPLVDPVFISDLHLALERPAHAAAVLSLHAGRCATPPRACHPGRLVRVLDRRRCGTGGQTGHRRTGSRFQSQAARVLDAWKPRPADRSRVRSRGRRDIARRSDHRRRRRHDNVAVARRCLVHARRRLSAVSRDGRNPEFQRGFLAKSVDERIAVAKSARMQSDTEKSLKAMDIMDVTPEAIDAALKSAGVRRIIHGHTHRPAAHVIDLESTTAERWVLPDWDLDDAEPRGGYLDFVDGRPRLVFFDD